MATTMPPLAVPSSLVEDDARGAAVFDELPRLRQPVLSRGRVNHQQHFVGRMGDFPRRDAAHLVEFRHQVELGVQPPRSVHDHQIEMAAFGCRERIKEDRRGVGAGLLLDHLQAQPVRPDFELFVGGGAERIGGTEQRPAVLLEIEMSQLGDAGGFAHAVDAHHEDDLWHARRGLLGFGGGALAGPGILENPQDLLLDRRAQLACLGELALADLLPQPAQDFLRGLYTQISGDERGFQVVEHRFVQSCLGLDNLLDTFHELGFRRGDRLLQPVEKAGSLLLFTGTKQGDHKPSF